MRHEHFRELLEKHQICIYFCSVALATILALNVQGTNSLGIAINPTLAWMLFVTFLQVPLAELRPGLSQIRFISALFFVNFLILPLIVFGLVQFLPIDPMLRLGVFLVLLTPCVDYVVTFTQLGRGDARLLLASTPFLLILQILLLPVYLKVFMGGSAAKLVKLGPFIHAFIWLIAVPLCAAFLVQLLASHNQLGKRINKILCIMPVPATAIVLFIVTAAMVPLLNTATHAVLQVIPIYIAFAIIAPFMGWFVAKTFQLEIQEGRSISFSAAIRNSLVVLPLAMAVPGAIPVLPAIIVTQTLIELGSALFYIRLIPYLTKRDMS